MCFGHNCAGEGKDKVNKKASLNSEIKEPGKKDYDKAFPEIKQEELKKLIKSGEVVLIDANSAESYASSHIPGALHFDKKSKKIEGSLPENKENSSSGLLWWTWLRGMVWCC